MPTPLSVIKYLLVFWSLLSVLHAEEVPAEIDPTSVAVLYNSADKESEKLAIHYARQRRIPTLNLIGLELPLEDTITRSDYNQKIRDPLIQHFDKASLWVRKKDRTGALIPTRNRIRVLLLMKGVPFRIKRTEQPKNPNEKPIKTTRGKEDESSVDSELVYLGVSQYNLAGPLSNPYYKKEAPISDPYYTPLLFTCRLDAPTYSTCERIIADSIAVEQTGLWGTCYLDEAHKGPNYEIANEWMRSVAQLNRKEGIPTVVDTFGNTFPTNYPMNQASLYFGWYAKNANGPLLNPRFKFKKGAVAIHLHSFSGAELRHPKKNWIGPILEKGAAATAGNVWEPYLSATHNFDILHDRLLKGYSLVEAAHMAMPVHSWQSIIVGDPLYRPFFVYTQTQTAAEEDKAYRAYRLANTQWQDDPDTFILKLRTAAARTSSGTLYEAIGLYQLEKNNIAEAKAFFQSAARAYPGDPDKLRQALHLISIHRKQEEKQAALEHIQTSLERFGDIPERKALIGLRNILDPPAPPPAKSKAAQ